MKAYDSLHEGIWIYDNISLDHLRMGSVSDKRCGENQNTISC